MAASTPSPEVLAYEKEHFYDSVVPQIMVGASISIAVTVGTTALRFIARKQRKAPLQSDDWLMLLAMTMSVTLAILRILPAARGINGHHIWNVAALHPNEFFTLTQEVVAFSTIFCLDLGVIRASILMLYLRLFPIPRFRIYVWIVQVAQLSYVIAFAVCVPLECIPLKRLLDPSIPGHCINIYTMLLVGAIINIFMDCTVFFLPLPLLWGLHVPTYRKFALCGLFVLGSGVCFVCVYRAIRNPDFLSHDFTWDTVDLGHLNVAESTGGIFCGNLTVIYPLFANPMSRWFSSISSLVRSSRSNGVSDKSYKSGTSAKASWPSRKTDENGDSEIGLTDLDTVVFTKSQPDDVEMLSFTQKHSGTENGASTGAHHQTI